MADASITLNTGSGGAKLATYTDTGSIDHQRVVLEMQSSTSDPVHVNSTNPLPVDGSGVTQPVSAASLPLPTGAATAAKQPALGTAGAASTDVLTVQGIASMVALKVDGSAVTQPVSGTFWQATQPVSAASLPLPTGAATAAKQPALGTAGTASADVITVQGIASMTALKVDGSGVTQPVSGTFWQTTQPVSLASLPALAAGTNSIGTVQPGNTANTTPWLTTNVPGTSPGSTASRVKAAASTNATSLKASAGVVLGYGLYNNTSSAKFFKFYNKASSPTVGTDTPLFTVIIPASGGANVEFSSGIPFSTGIAYAITGAVADSDTTATSADDVHGLVLWK